jgi:3-oxoacyl-[acyl-carrier protein] reductase
MTFDFRDQVVLVTGGSRGIGREIVLAAVGAGARVLFCARRLNEASNSVLEQAHTLAGPGRALAVKANVSVETDVEALFARARTEFGGVDVVINNAGITHDTLFVSSALPDIDEVLDVNLTGAFLVSRSAVRSFLEQKRGGCILTLGSIAQEGMPSSATYAASKGGLRGLTHAIAAEYGSEGIRAHLLVAGVVETELTAALSAAPASRTALVEYCPQRRTASPREIAEAALFLASAQDTLPNGSSLRVAGGLRELPYPMRPYSEA